MIDVLSSAPHYRAHLLPAWEALAPRLRGQRIDLDGGGPPQFRALRSVPRPGAAAVVASFRDMGRAWARGYRRIAYLEHGIGQSYCGLDRGEYPGGPGRDPVSLFLSPNETAAAADRARYPGARVEIVGDPALDALPARLPGGPPTVAVSFHWDWTALPETRSALDHYRGALAGLAAEFPVLGHAHPKALDALAPVYRRAGIELVTSFGEICRRADMYASDNSSTIFEFASTGRPVILLNAPWYRRGVEHGLRFWAAAGVGWQCDEPGDLAVMVRLAFTARCPDSAPAALAIAYAYPSGAAARAAAALESWA